MFLSCIEYKEELNLLSEYKLIRESLYPTVKPKK